MPRAVCLQDVRGTLCDGISTSVVEGACAPQQCAAAAYTGVLLNNKDGRWRLLQCCCHRIPFGTRIRTSLASREFVSAESVARPKVFFCLRSTVYLRTSSITSSTTTTTTITTTNNVYHYHQNTQTTRSVRWTFRSHTALYLLIIPFVIYKRKYYTYSTHNTSYTAMPPVVS